MKNKYLEVFTELKKQLDSYPNETKNQRYLQIMLERRLKNLPVDDADYEVDKVSRKLLYAVENNIKLEDVDSKEAQNAVDIKKIQQALSDFISSQRDSKEAFQQIGFVPIIEVDATKGGRGKEKLFWFDIESFEQFFPLELEDEEVPKQDYSEVRYQREPTSKIKPSLFMRMFFKDGELKMMSVKGILLMILMLLSLLFDIFLVLFSILVIIFVKDIPSLSLWEAITFMAFIPFVYMNFLWFFKPIHHLMTHRVSKAPLFFASINTDNADVEMYKGSDNYRVARITAFTAICPICTAPIELADGKPDQKAPLVGRCREAPHAHVYSFDRMTLKGYFLGHQGYLSLIGKG